MLIADKLRSTDNKATLEETTVYWFVLGVS